MLGRGNHRPGDDSDTSQTALAGQNKHLQEQQVLRAAACCQAAAAAEATTTARCNRCLCPTYRCTIISKTDCAHLNILNMLGSVQGKAVV